MLPLAGTLKSVRNRITQLEKGVQFYFATKKELGIDYGLYLIYCDNENTYVWNDQALISMRTMNPETLEEEY